MPRSRTETDAEGEGTPNVEKHIGKVAGSNGVRPSSAVYGLTLAAVAVAGLLRWLFDPFLGDQLPFIVAVHSVRSM